MSPGLNKKRIVAIGALVLCLCSIALPFSPSASAAGSSNYFTRTFYLTGTDQSSSLIYATLTLSTYAGYWDGYPMTDGSSKIELQDVYVSKVLGILTIHNQSDLGWLSDNTLFRFLIKPSNVELLRDLTDIQYIGGYLKPTALTTGESYAFTPISSDNAQSRLFAISPKSSVSCVFELTYRLRYSGSSQSYDVAFSNSTVNLSYPTTVTGTFGDYVTTNVDYIPSIYEGLVDMNGNITAQFNALIQYLESINKPANAPDVTNDSQDQLDIIEQQHTNEQSYFEQNAQNLQATGISNFQFDGDTVNSLTALTTDFTSLWNALGEWKFIYLFTLMISLATFLIRHRSQSSGRRTSDKGASHG